MSGRSPYDRKKMAVLKTGGKAAVTNYKTAEVFGQAASLVQCNLETGRTHQIRVHMSSLGCSLIGDQVYEKAKKSGLRFRTEAEKNAVLTFPRQALHAATLGFVHPVSGKSCGFIRIFRRIWLDCCGFCCGGVKDCAYNQSIGCYLQLFK